MVSADPIEFEIVLLEQITLMSTAPKTVDQLVKIADGGIGLQAQQVQATTSAFDVLDKIKAFLFSFSYASCATPDWCKFSQVRMAYEEISVKVQAAERHSAPLSFYSDAYLASSQVWQQRIVMEKESFTKALTDTGAWLYFWTYQCPGCVVCVPGLRKGKGKGVPQAAGNSIEFSNRQMRKQAQNQMWNTLMRFNEGAKGGKAGNGGAKGAYQNTIQWQVQKQQAWKQGGKDDYRGKGEGKGKGKGKGKGGKWY